MTCTTIISGPRGNVNMVRRIDVEHVVTQGAVMTTNTSMNVLKGMKVVCDLSVNKSRICSLSRMSQLLWSY